ncbi:MAG: alpha/beta fold hydrolase [Chloroflexota bacterium]|jgi:pimeloyl-ACP methyl ester carboxylesterase
MIERPAAKIGLARAAWLLLSLAAIALAWWQVAGLEDGLQSRRFEQDGVPLIFLAPEEGEDLPGVIVAHGFSGSKQLMLGYGYTLSRAGYAVMLLDFAGHGANARPMDTEGDALQRSLEVAYRALIDMPQVDPTRLALLGHSMGSGAVMQAGVERPERYRAVIAISPTDADVSETRPPNLMLQAGSLEGRFVANALDLLARAGGPSQAFAVGQARTFEEIANVEHITILFSSASQDLAIEWLNQSFGLSNAAGYRDPRMAWYALHTIGWLSLLLALKPLLPLGVVAGPSRSRRRQWLGLLLGTLVATGLLALAGRWIDLSAFLGILVGGVLAIWLAIMGGLWLGLGFRPQVPALRSMARGAGLFVLLWLALGLMAQFTWLQWFLVPARLSLWPLFALAALPWKVAAGYAQQGGTFWRRAGWWLGQSAILVGGLLLAAMFVPGMGILVLIAPVLPLVLAVESLAGVAFDEPWAYGIGSALFFGWLIAALFPLV